MIKRINTYLLTHYPLLWNTRVVWVLFANFLLHLFFFLGGAIAIQPATAGNFYSVSNVGGGSLYTLAVLCSLVVLILWCVFYLRNNAFKSFYRLPKSYLAKEFLLMVLILFTSISFPLSFQWGVRTKVRSFTGEATMIKEINTINRAMAFVPIDKSAYFILNNCAEKRKRNPGEPQDLPVGDTNAMRSFVDPAKLRTAFRQPDAYSYKHYCRLTHENYFYKKTLDSSEVINSTINQWLQQQKRDSVEKTIAAFFSVLKKYKIDYRLDEANLANAVFRDSNFAVGSTLPTQRFTYTSSGDIENEAYITINQLTTAFDFVESCQPNERTLENQKEEWNVTGYIALSLAILLLCYRRFSRKVFLISVVGTLVWAILLSLFAAGGAKGEGMSVLMLVLTAVFLLWTLAMLAQKSNKASAGVTLNWHGYLAPYFLLFVYTLIKESYRSYEYRLQDGADYDKIMQASHPFGYWVVHHTTDLFFANLFLVCLYMAVWFNRWAKQWQLMPEE